MQAVTLHPNRPIVMVHNPDDVEALLFNVRPSKIIQLQEELVFAAVHNSDTVRVLRNMGIEAPSSLTTRYKWPGRYTPMSHQFATAEFLTMHHKCLNLSDMGTGKTAAALWAADHLMLEKIIRRVVVVAPLSCLTPVWQREIFTVTPHRSVTVLHDKRYKRRQQAEHSMTDYFIINHDGLEVVKDLLMKRGDIDLIIYDEASALKNGQTNRFKLLEEILKVTGARLWLLTGTPTPNAPTDAWSLGRLTNPFNAETNPQGTPRSMVRFRDQTMRPAGPYKWVARPTAQIIVRNILRPAIRFNKSDCLDLPPITYTNRVAALTAEQLTAYNAMMKTLQTEAKTARGEGLVITAINAAGRLSKLLQICSGAVYAPDKRVGKLDMAHRLAVLSELIEEAGKKVLVFVPFRHAIERVHEYLTSEGVTCGIIHGDIKGDARTLVIRRFMDNADPKVLIAHPRTASYGLNFTCADTAVWFGPTFSAEGYQQANERMARPGQTSHMTIAHIYSTVLEEKAFKLLSDRQSTQQGLLSLYEEALL